jgi:anti-sigma factor RsiW
MTCAQLYERLTELMEGTLPADVCEEINRHLADCNECPRLREDLEDLARLCREASAPSTMPEDLRSRIAQMLAEPNPDQSVGRRS